MPRLACLLLLFLGACASVTTGTTQTIAIESEPPGAACALQRAGDTIARVARTPADVTVTRASMPIELDCSLENHLPGRTTVPSGIQAMTFGNVLIGGVIGVVVDAASGAIHSYPQRARVDLSPESFKSAEARDAYFEARRARLQAALGAIQARYAEQCGGGDRNPNAARCAAEMDSVLAQAERALERVEAERLAARVAPEGAPTALAQAQADPAPAPEAEAAQTADARPAPAAEPTADPPALTPSSATLADPADTPPAPPPTPVQTATVAAPAQEPAPAPAIQHASAPAVVAPPAERWRMRLRVKTPIVPRSWCRPNESGEAEFSVVDGRSKFKLRSDNYSIATVTARLDDPDGPALRVRFRGQSSPRPFSVKLPQPAGPGAVVERTVLYTHSYTPCEYTVALERLTPDRPATVVAAAGAASTGVAAVSAAGQPDVAPPADRWRLRMSVTKSMVSRTWCQRNESGEAEFTVVDGRSEFELRSDNYGRAEVAAQFDEPDGPALRIVFRGQINPDPLSLKLPRPAGLGDVVERTVLYSHPYYPCEYRLALERLTPERPATVVAETGAAAETDVGARQAGDAAAPAAPDAVSAYEARLAELETLLAQMRSELSRIKAKQGDAGEADAETAVQ